VIVGRGYMPLGRKCRTAGYYRFEHAGSASLIARLRGHNPSELARNAAASTSARRRSATTVPVLTARDEALASKSSATFSLRQAIRIRIGSVTGDARFFVLSDSERRRLALPSSISAHRLPVENRTTFADAESAPLSGPTNL
jgi:hypothetical protein